MSLFKACDIRGVYGQDLTDEMAYRIARASGTILRQRHPAAPCRAVVGGDVRISTPALKAAAIEGLQQSGLEVLDLGIVPTPGFYFAHTHLSATAGLMVTASHNPPSFNGFKILLGKLPITPEDLLQIQDRALQGRFIAGCGTVESVDVSADYQRYLQKLARPLASGDPPFRLVVDCGHGCFSQIAPAVLRALGYQVQELFCEFDGNFPQRAPDPARPENLSALQALVPSTRARLGVAFDGDGDRVSFVDEKGQVVPSDFAAILLAPSELAQTPGGKVVYDLKCSQLLRDAIVAAGGVPLMERSGHTFLKTRMITEGAVFGAEISGHFFYGRLNGGDDGLYSALRMAEILRASSQPLSTFLEELPRVHITPDLRIPWQGGAQVLETIGAAFPPEQVSRIDGVRVQFEDGWALARLSVTEPALTLRFEAATAERLASIQSEFLRPVPELARRLAACRTEKT